VEVVTGVATDAPNGYAAYDVSLDGTLAYLPSAVYSADRLLTEVTRRGNERRLLPAPARYAEPRLAPDGRRFALTVTPPGGNSDVWVHDPARDAATRLTTHGASDFGAEWVNGGREIVYMSERPLFELYRREADASRPERPFLAGDADRISGGVSAAGRLLAFMFSRPADQQLWTVRVDSAGTARAYLQSEFDISHPAPSPNERWLAYDSDESGQVEVYVQSYPDPTRSRRQVSSGGGSEPLWTRGGREIVFRRGGAVLAAAFDPATGEVDRPVELFSGPYLDQTEATSPRSWDAARDGERFLMLRWPPERGSPRVEVVLGWLRELERQVRP
jgi:Tol biopolymer transport system component